MKEIKTKSQENIIQVKIMTPEKIAICAPDDFFVDDDGNYQDVFRVDIHENLKCECGALIDCETGFKTMNDAITSAIDHI